MLSKDVKLLGVALGNNAKQVDAFKKQFRAAYPIVPDEERKIGAILEHPGTPTMIICAKDGKVLAVHGGMIEDFDAFLKEIRDLHGKL
jgi:hypothetical protein